MASLAVAWFCEHLVRIRERAGALRLSAEAESLIEALRAGRPVPDEELIEFARRLGGEPDLHRGVRIPGISGGEQARVRYVCPDDRCFREGEREPSGPVPTCHLSGRRLRTEAGLP